MQQHSLNAINKKCKWLAFGNLKKAAEVQFLQYLHLMRLKYEAWKTINNSCCGCRELVLLFSFFAHFHFVKSLAALISILKVSRINKISFLDVRFSLLGFDVQQVITSVMSAAVKKTKKLQNNDDSGSIIPSYYFQSKIAARNYEMTLCRVPVKQSVVK